MQLGQWIGFQIDLPQLEELALTPHVAPARQRASARGLMAATLLRRVPNLCRDAAHFSLLDGMVLDTCGSRRP